MTESQTSRPPMMAGESDETYTRRTGYYPPHWSSDRCREQDAKIHNAEMAGDRRYLRRWGA